MRETFSLWVRRSGRGALIWMVAIAVMVGVASFAVVREIDTPAEAARFEKVTTIFAQTFSPMFGRAEALGTVGGFLTWRILSVLGPIAAIFSILAATRMTLGEERRGATDLVLSSPRSRAQVFSAQAGALAADCLVLAVPGLLLGWVGVRLVGGDMGLVGAFWAGLGLALVALLWGMVAMLAAQFLRTRAAAGAVTAVVMLVSYLVTNLSVTRPGFEPLARLSPFSAYAANRPLVPGRGADLVALALLSLCAAAAWGVAVAVFTRRDLNVGGLLSWPFPGRIDASPLLRGPVLRDAWSLKGIALAWGIGLGLFIALFTAVENDLRGPIEELLRGQGPFGEMAADQLLGSGPIALLIFNQFANPVLGIFAALQVGRWAADVEAGHLTLALATPVGRARLLLGRLAAVLLTAGLALAIAWVVAVLSAGLTGTELSWGQTALGIAARLFLVLVFVGFGLAVAGWWRPAWAAGLTGGLVIVNLLYDLVRPVFALPSWTAQLSLLERMGDPFREGLTGGGHGVLLAVGLVLTTLAVAGFERRDLV